MSAHEAGRDMDGAIAEKVVGLKPYRSPTGGWFYLDCGIPEMVPNYSTDIAAAWLLVEKLAATQCDFSLERAGDNNWYAMTELATSRGNTAPLAICRAALAAMEAP